MFEHFNAFTKLAAMLVTLGVLSVMVLVLLVAQAVLRDAVSRRRTGMSRTRAAAQALARITVAPLVRRAVRTDGAPQGGETAATWSQPTLVHAGSASVDTVARAA